ncbi:membrane-bound lytic murein transglycosylase [Catenovulum agarivorans DS-2]|uniref:Membrane-bound lytic murein transglycosylase n=1 Tax=Catenovulum agarivorans DS-2 TaxID=1328313 RepID=W7QJP8_9ALTE|nr:LysM peptidoglycan-binding domain-containing protein [Catenovulum agarivorans]EWH12101.1 membrane-bound lytic murein transglycosylase [Catenovulum agarivorans DS-2]
MYKRTTLWAALLTLTGCQSIPDLKQSFTVTNQTESTNDTSQFIAAIDDSTEVYADISQVVALNQGVEANEVVYGDVWKRIQSQLSLPVAENRRLQIQRAWYVNHPEYLNRVAKRAEPFLYYIVEEIEKRELPMELALLPIVESAFDPYAYSPSAASGLWQFMPTTAKRFGLAQNWWYDGRRDIVASTKAALDYLEKLHQQFDGNWLHALAAYNSGEGRVARAIQKNYRSGENIDYWSLELPRETDAYVPKLLALADIVKRPYKYGIDIYSIANVQVVDVVEVESQIDLAIAAELAEMNVNDFTAYNPGYSRWATSPDGPHKFLLPIDKAEAFKANMANKPSAELISWRRYQIQSGDTLSTIAQRHQTTIETIRTANKIKGHHIRKGDYLMIPTSAARSTVYPADDTTSSITDATMQDNQSSIQYTVKRGDTFWDIGKAHKVNIRDLAKWNNMSPSDPIYPGQTLTIQQPDAYMGKYGDVPTTRKVKYKVRSGDSLARIAQKFRVTISDIENWNKISRRNYLQPEQQLVLHVDVTGI